MSTGSNGSGAGTVAIVSGAAHGIGRTTATRLAADGASVAMNDIAADELQASVEQLQADGTDVVALPGDVSTGEGARRLIAGVVDWRGRVDVLVNNAGGGVIRAFLEHDDESIEQTVSRNLLTTIHCCRATIPVMIEQGGGRIVNVGAESVRNGLLQHAMYNGAKGGVHGLTSGLAREFAEHGIIVNCVAPSITATEMAAPWLAEPDTVPGPLRPVLDQAVELIPMGRAAEMEEVAAAIVFLASEQASFITGQVLSVNGGSSMQ